jgi:hypothetical protein
MVEKRDPLLESLKVLIRVAGETVGSANDRDYAKTRELMARRASAALVGTDYRAELRKSGQSPNKTYRCIEELDRNLKACLSEMDSVQSAANADVILNLKRAHATATEFTTTAEREDILGG